MKANQAIRLIPVLEVPPYDFCKAERTAPEKSILEAPQAWINYNQSCYNDSGLNNIKPYKPLSWLFKIESLSDGELKIILKHLIDSTAEDFDSIKEILDDPVEYAPLIPGGYLFEVNEIVKSEPGCCCGLENILDWKGAEIVLTGHGDNDFVQITRTKSQVEISIEKEIFICSKKDYNKIIKKAEVKIDRFIEKSGVLINDLLEIKNGQSFAKAMIYKWD